MKMEDIEAIKYLGYLRENYTREGGLMCQAVDKAIAALKPAPVRTKADKIRAMTDEELAIFMVTQAIMGAMATNGIRDIDKARKATREIINSDEAQADIAETIEWLRKEADEDANN